MADSVVTYSRYSLKEDKELIVIRYKEIVDAALTEGKTAAELKAAVTVAEGEETLPAIEEVKYLKTRVCKNGDKFVVLASTRYVG